MNADERRLRDSIDAVANHILRLRELNADEPDPLRVLEIRRLEEQLNGPDECLPIEPIRDRRSGRIIARRDRRVGGLWAELREARCGRVRPIETEDWRTCSRCDQRVRESELYRFRERGRVRVRSWCTRCEREWQRGRYLERVHRAAAESSPVDA
ncbi:MAG TPA: hypothetical protein VMU73_08405 [Gaiellaceae bacterium]|nr:hypothetical protein [Gaiellaceae bacterium]